MKPETRIELLNDLKKSGFASEISAIKKAKKEGWDVIPNYAFLDPQEDKPRTIDFVGWKILTYPPDSDLMHNGAQIFLVGEVKKTERPWIVFTEEGEHEQNIDIPIISGCDLPTDIATFGISLDDPLVKSKGFIGYNIHESFKTPSDSSRWFGAALSSIKAAEAINKWEIEAHSPSKDEIKPYPDWFFFTLRYFQPLVIVDGDLFQTHIASVDEIDISHLDMVSIRVKYEVKGMDNGYYRVHIVQINAFEKYLRLIDEHHPKLIDAVFEAGNQNNKEKVWKDQYLKQQRQLKSNKIIGKKNEKVRKPQGRTGEKGKAID